jgi:hypothetical protein
MKLPRDLAGRELARALGKAFGYQVTRETGSGGRGFESRRPDG